MRMKPPFSALCGGGPIVATAIHAGNSLRPEVAAAMHLDPATRLREEDPHTDVLADVVPYRVCVDRSRFEVDLNRPRDEAVYVELDQAWGLDIWRERPSDEIVERSLAIHDAFYQEMARRLDALARHGRFVVLDVHSYNHRRHGPDAPAAPIDENPDINLGTGSLDHSRWGALVERFAENLTAALAEKTTYGENVRFRGGHFPTWVNERYEGAGCALALEFKKTFMDEWTGVLDERRLYQLRDALAATAPGLIAALGNS